MLYKPENFKEVATQELAKVEQVNMLAQLGVIFKYLCDTGMNQLENPQEEKRIGAQIRQNSLHALPTLLEEFEQNAKKNGIEVLWAADAQEANEIVLELTKKHNVKLITKGKSMISEELELNHFLKERLGNEIEIHEGDLGEFIVQIRNSSPFHIVGPAINLSVKEIADTLVKHIDMPYTENASEIVSEVRKYLRDKFENAEMGITGVNMGVASTGSIILVENEGNIRWVTGSPKVHVALMSLEKVVANLGDALQMVNLLTRNCTGQAITTYVSILNGPRKTEERNGPEHMYIVIIDNGRSKIYNNPELRDALRCIRCGRCGTTCPIYIRVGAYPYGFCYPGPIGTVLTPLLLGLDKTSGLYEGCTLCGECQNVCPAGVPHTELFHKYREMKVTGDKEFSATSTSFSERLAFKGFAWAMTNSFIYKLGLRFARIYLKLLAKEGYVQGIKGPMSGWFKCRDLPVIPDKSFRNQWTQWERNNAFTNFSGRGVSHD